MNFIQKKLKQWDLSLDIENLLFFALRIKELTFDYTLDSFKYPVLNVSSLCYEGIELIEEIERKNFNEKSIVPVLEELIFKLKEDLTAKKMIGNKLESYINFGDYNDLKDCKLKLQLIAQKVNPRKYNDEIVKEIKNLIITKSKEKKNLYDLTTYYITNLINLGFSQSFIYKNVNTLFFSRKKIENFEPLNEFFKNLSFEIQTYDVIIKCSRILLELSSSSDVFDSLITETIPEEYSQYDKQDFLKEISEHEVFFISKNIKALDPVSAKDMTEMRINKISKIFVFYHHKEHPVWSEKALVINSDTKYQFLINEKTSPMSKGRDLKPKKAASKMNRLFHNINLDENSFAKYNRVLDLHGLSVQNKNIENQLLQNWIAFETMLVGYSSKSKIEQVLEHLIPFLINGYFNNLLNEFCKDLIKYDNEFFQMKIKLNPIGEDFTQKFTSILVLDEHKTTRSEAYNILTNNPLLKYRLFDFHKKFSDVKSVEKIFERHKRLIDWQIKRMYRSRNLIVHAGIIPDFTESLVENSHTYLDLLINTINNLSIDEKSIISIEQAIKEIKITTDIHQKEIIKNRDKRIDINNYKKIILNV
jgi:hypothetical protein